MLRARPYPPLAADVLDECDAYPSHMANGSARRDDREVGGAWSSFQRHWYGDPSPDLAPFISGYWFVEWDLHGQPPYRQLIVPNPTVHLSFVHDTAAAVHGVARGHVFRTLEGVGRVFGVAFRPGCFRPFLGSAVSSITDRSVLARDVFGFAVAEPVMSQATDEVQMVNVVERFLRAKLPSRDPTAETVGAIVTRIAAEPDITRVDTLADQHGSVSDSYSGCSPSTSVSARSGSSGAIACTWSTGVWRWESRSTGLGLPPTSGMPTRRTSAVSSPR